MNPIESFWAVFKRQFIKDCVTDADFRNQEEIKALGMKNIIEASSDSIEKHFFAFFILM